MLESILLTQFIALIIMGLFLFQTNGKLEKHEFLDVIGWLGFLFILSYSLICSTLFEISSFSLLMMASLNGIMTVFFIFSKKILKIK
ncbi:hypothetical protein [Vagococcus carniphilus]|uniref:hypothetical protein n=1 Tax=Vagococcus carniphilus TaxID=218144 RepID=UPI0028902BD8|nr:hypothetical protein [Vagococcus carniphilus]MDT2863730.1 hypothetical protein [Vagococcus carniphilus]